MAFIVVGLVAGLLVALLLEELDQPNPFQTFPYLATFPYLETYLVLAVLAGYVVSCLWSPVQAVRDLVAPVFHWRVPWSCYAFALILGPLLGALVLVLSWLLLPTSGNLGSRQLVGLFELAEEAIIALVVAVSWVVGWYGFAARRLLVRRSPLAVALLLGGLLWAADLLPQLVNLHRYDLLIGDTLLGSVGSLTAAVIAIWLYNRSVGSLLPMVLWVAMGTFTTYGAAQAQNRLGVTGFLLVYEGAQCLLAIALVVSSRMWRRPATKIATRPMPTLADSSG